MRARLTRFYSIRTLNLRRFPLQRVDFAGAGIAHREDTIVRSKTRPGIVGAHEALLILVCVELLKLPVADAQPVPGPRLERPEVNPLAVAGPARVSGPHRGKLD